MVYIRGNAYDYDHWSQLGNGAGRMKACAYFKRAEDFSGDGDEEYHGHGGPLSVPKNQTAPMMNCLMCLSKPVSKPASHSLKTLTAKARKVCRAMSTRYAVKTVQCRARLSASALERKNLHTQTDVTVERIEFEAKKATGVTFSRKGKSVTVKAEQGSYFVGGRA